MITQEEIESLGFKKKRDDSAVFYTKRIDETDCIELSVVNECFDINIVHDDGTDTEFGYCKLTQISRIKLYNMDELKFILKRNTRLSKHFQNI